MTKKELKEEWLEKGMTEKRINWFLDEYSKKFNPILTVEELNDVIEKLVDEWGIEDVNNGYGKFDYHYIDFKDNGKRYMLGNILRIDALEIFGGDEEALTQAIKNGVKIIPINELPDNLPDELVCFRWLDDEQTREALNEISKNNR